MGETMDQNPADTIFDPNADRLREECGVFGIFGHPDAAAITALGLHALQHRGQEAAGIVSFDGKRFHSERRMGLVGDNFSRREVIDRLPGMSAVGHVRYSTTGETILRNVQPLFAELEGGGFAIGHNGNLTNGLTLRRQLVAEGAMMQSTTDTEVILHLVARAKRNRFIDRFIEGLRQLEGASPAAPPSPAFPRPPRSPRPAHRAIRPPDHADARLHARRQHRHHGAHRGRRAEQASRPADRGGKPARRWRHRFGGGGRPRRAGRPARSPSCRAATRSPRAVQAALLQRGR